MISLIDKSVFNDWVTISWIELPCMIINKKYCKKWNLLFSFCLPVIHVQYTIAFLTVLKISNNKRTDYKQQKNMNYLILQAGKEDAKNMKYIKRIPGILEWHKILLKLSACWLKSFSYFDTVSVWIHYKLTLISTDAAIWKKR